MVPPPTPDELLNRLNPPEAAETPEVGWNEAAEKDVCDDGKEPEGDATNAVGGPPPYEEGPGGPNEVAVDTE